MSNVGLCLWLFAESFRVFHEGRLGGVKKNNTQKFLKKIMG